MSTYFIKTFGCQMNVNDSEVMAGLLEKEGYSEAATPEKADIILINTCCVRQKAEDKAFGFALGLIAPKMKKPGRIIAICGCIAEKDKHEIFRKLPFVDLVIGPGQEARVVQLINDIKGGAKNLIASGDHCGQYPTKTAKRAPSSQAYVTIMFGCNNFCSYCIVPFVRGKEISRAKEEIIKEIEGLDKRIYKEVVLLGQNVNSYTDRRPVTSDSRPYQPITYQHINGNEYRLPELLADVSKIKGVERIRFLTSHPRDMTDDIIDAVRDLPKVCEYFHLPLQSGDDKMLKAMNRGYTAEHFRKLVEKIRAKVPEAAITSDAIAGFPGETEKQFQNTLDLIKEIEPDAVNTFAYSNRPGTPASKLEGQIPKEVVSVRLQRLMEVVEASAFKRSKKLVGSTQEVLVDSRSKEGLVGRTRGNKIVFFEGKEDLIGKLVPVRIETALEWALRGKRA